MNHHLGHVRLVKQDENNAFTFECIEAIVSSFVHTVSFVRAMGPIEPKECQYLHGIHEDDQGDRREDRVIVSTVNDAPIHFRTTCIVKLIARTLLSDLEEHGKGHVRLDIEFGTTDSMHRNKLQKARNERQRRRAKSLWYRRSSNSLEERPSSVFNSYQSLQSMQSSVSSPSSSSSPTIIGSLFKLWGGRFQGEGSSENSSQFVRSMLQQSSDRMLRISNSSLDEFVCVDSSSEENAKEHVDGWQEAVSEVENALVKSHSYSFAGVDTSRFHSATRTANDPIDFTLTSDEEKLLEQAVLKELKTRAIEDDGLCRNVWETWSIELCLESRKPVEKEKSCVAKDEEEEMVFFFDEEPRNTRKHVVRQGSEYQPRTKEKQSILYRYAGKVNGICRRIMNTVLRYSSETLADHTPNITQSGMNQPLCWPMRLSVKKDVGNEEKRLILFNSAGNSHSVTADYRSRFLEVKDQEDCDLDCVDVVENSCSPPSTFDFGRDVLREFLRGGPGLTGI